MRRTMMMKRWVAATGISAFLVGGVTLLWAQGQAGGPVVYFSQADLAAMLKEAANPERGLTTARIARSEDYRISIQQRTKVLGAVTHDNQMEMHYIISGSGTLVTGGALRRPEASDGRAVTTIVGGDERRVAPGDSIVIPPGTPHWYSAIDGGEITFLEVAWDSPAQAR